MALAQSNKYIGIWLENAFGNKARTVIQQVMVVAVVTYSSPGAFEGIRITGARRPIQQILHRLIDLKNIHFTVRLCASSYTVLKTGVHCGHAPEVRQTSKLEAHS